MATRKRPGVKKPPAVPLPPPMKVLKPAHYITAGRMHMTCECDSCAERFYVDAEELRVEGEIEVKCPYCKRMLLVQHVEYAVAVTQEN